MKYYDKLIKQNNDRKINKNIEEINDKSDNMKNSSSKK